LTFFSPCFSVYEQDSLFFHAHFITLPEQMQQYADKYSKKAQIMKNCRVFTYIFSKIRTHCQKNTPNEIYERSVTVYAFGM